MAYKSASLKKQMSTPLEKIRSKQVSKPPKINKSPSVPGLILSKRASGQILASRTTPSTASSNQSFFVNRMVPRDIEILSALESPEWIEKTISEKKQWILKFINETKAGIGSVLRHQHVVDLIMDENSKDLKSETNELLSMSNINSRVSVTDDCLRAIRLKLLEDKCVCLSTELENREKTIKYQSEQLNKDTDSRETQTCGINIEELEKSNSDVSAKNLLLSLELNESKEIIEHLERDLNKKSDELTSVSTENSLLKSKIENLNKTFEEMKETNSKQIERISSLQSERIKFKQDFFEVQKERDDYYASWMEVKHKYEKASEKLQKLISESDTIRREEIHRSMIENDLINKTEQLEKEIAEKETEMAKLRSSVGQLENSIEKHREVDERRIKTINKLKANVAEMETRAECWINRFVRDNFESKINLLEQQLEKLQVDKGLLSEKYNETTWEHSKQIANIDKDIEKLHTYIGEQQKLIDMMRRVKFNPAKYQQSESIEGILMKFENEQRLRKSLKELMEENYRLKKMNRSANN